jgi:hypothetical protein
MNENGLEEYEKKETFSKEFRSFLSVRLQQWNTQLTKSNFEHFLLCFCENLSRTYEHIIINKRFTQIGALLLDKVINYISFIITIKSIKIIFD